LSVESAYGGEYFANNYIHSIDKLISVADGTIYSSYNETSTFNVTRKLVRMSDYGGRNTHEKSFGAYTK